jgi:hypothetical protein
LRFGILNFGGWGLEVKNLGFGISGLRFGGSEVRVWDSRFGVQGLRFWVMGDRF